MGVGTCFFSFFVDVCFFDVFSLKKWWKQLVSQGTFSLGLIQEPQTGNFDAAIVFQMVFLRLQSIHLIDLFGMIAAEWSSFQVQRFAAKKDVIYKKMAGQCLRKFRMVGSVESMGMLVSGAAKKVGVCIINSPLHAIVACFTLNINTQRLSEDDNFTDDVLHLISPPGCSIRLNGVLVYQLVSPGALLFNNFLVIICLFPPKTCWYQQCSSSVAQFCFKEEFG